jgi:hypothetical protein
MVTDGKVSQELHSAEMVGIQLVKWMQAQASDGGSLQNLNSATASPMETGASLTAQFSSDLAALGATINGESGTSQASDMLAAESALNGAIYSSTRDSAASGNYSLSISDSSLTASASSLAATSGSSTAAVASASADALSIHISDYNSSTSGGSGQGSYDIAINYNSSQSTEAASSIVSNGNSTSTVSSGSVSANSNFALQADVETANGVSVLTQATEKISIYAAERTVSETGNGNGSTSGSNVNLSSGSLDIASAMMQAGVSAQTDAALMKQWVQALYGAGNGAQSGANSGSTANGANVNIYA